VFLIDNPDEPLRPRAKILDWGIAKEIETDVSRTVDGLLVGTPQYVSPEQARGDHLTPATDVYSLGVMAFELFLEQLPFEADTSAELMTMHLRATPPTPSNLWPDIPVGLEQLLLAMLAKKPDKRPTMLTVAHTLELVRDDLDRRRGLPVREARTPTRRYPTPAFVDAPARWRPGATRWQVALGGLALVACAALFVITRDSDSVAATITTPTATAPAPVARPSQPPPAQVAAAPDPVTTPAPARVAAPVALVHEAVAVGAVHREPARAVTHELARAVAHVASHPIAKPAVVADSPWVHQARPKTAPVQAAPRLSVALDPDGSIDAYR
jgi:serine/threonine-protein kinase